MIVVKKALPSRADVVRVTFVLPADEPAGDPGPAGTGWSRQPGFAGGTSPVVVLW
jgi:hypothetical protein